VLEDLDVDAPSHDPFLGTVLDKRYKIESKLGSGGMGDVYAARHIIIDKPVAVKILRLEYSKDPRQAERFIREARAASHIGHPNIVDVTDFGRLDNSQIYFIMEFLLGVTLGKELKTHGALTTRRSLTLAIQICNALEAAHSKGIVHRDLKPENIFIVNPLTKDSTEHDAGGRHQDTIKLLDFGIAKITWDEQGRRLTKVGSVFGTPQYMSPEQAAGKDTDHRGDIYALGCIIYEMLTGEVPFIAETFMGTLTKQMFENPIPPRQLRPDLGIPEPLEQVILHAMRKDPDERYQTMRELADALDACFSVSEMGPVQRAGERAGRVGERILVLQANAPIDAITAGDRETVHLLVEPKPEEPRRLAHGRSLWPLVLVGGGLFLGLSGTGIYMVLRDIPGRVVPAVPDASAAVAVVRRSDAAPTGPRADVGRLVSLRLSSIPRGAVVLASDSQQGMTPWRLQVAAGQALRLVFRKQGYHDTTIDITPNTDNEIEVPLRRKPPRARQPPKRPDASVRIRPPKEKPKKEDLLTPPELRKSKSIGR